MSKHTPGDWFVDPKTLNIMTQPTPYLHDGLLAATRYLGNDPERVREHEANALLMAASVKMYNALKHLLVDAIDREETHDEETEEEYEDWKEARLALEAAGWQGEE